MALTCGLQHARSCGYEAPSRTSAGTPFGSELVIVCWSWWYQRAVIYSTLDDIHTQLEYVNRSHPPKTTPIAPSSPPTDGHSRGACIAEAVVFYLLAPRVWLIIVMRVINHGHIGQSICSRPSWSSRPTRSSTQNCELFAIVDLPLHM